MMRIRTLPVYSKLAGDLPAKLETIKPAGWRLSQHQVDTYNALTSTNGADVVFNVAMTGDGKSLAGQLPSLVEGWHRPLFAMYPTNELIRDQRRQTTLTWGVWGRPSPFVAELNSSVLDDIMAEGDFSVRGDALADITKNNDVVLTNPDIFHYIMQLFYRRQGKTGDAPDKVIAPLITRYQQFTFDEFHIFEAPQIVSVVNALLLIDQLSGPNRPHQFLFQSATPNPLLLRYLERADLSAKIVEGNYWHTSMVPDSDKWRRILHGSEISFDQGSVETWLDDHLEDTLIPFFLRNRPGVKGAVIVNSVAVAKRVVDRLKEAFRPYGLTVEENTGLTSRTRRMRSYESDLLVGTSTVDVGVDFQINFLLFESRDAGTFLQRLGRMGRHDGYTKDGCTYQFLEYQAHAVLAPWIHEALFQGRDKQPPPLTDEMETDRSTLAQAIEWAFPHSNDFSGYAKMWGGLQSARVLYGFKSYVVRGQYRDSVQQLAQRYQSAFRTSMNSQVARLLALTKEQDTLVNEATSFRGGSYFTCGVIDETERGADRIKSYDLFALIAYGIIEELTPERFWSEVEQEGLSRKPIERLHPIGYLRLRGFGAERNNYSIYIERDLGNWGADRLGVAIEMTGITIDCDDYVPGLNAINRRLERKKLPALLCPGPEHPIEWKRRLRLPMLFPLFAFESRDGIQGTAVFGREALLMEVALRQSGIDVGGGAMIL